MSTKITVPDMEISQSAIDWVKKTYIEKFGSDEDFDENYQLALALDDFKASENIHEKMTNYKVSADELIDVENEYIKGESFDPKVHWILRMLETYYMHQVFHCMKVDQTDPNIAINSLGKGTPGRIVKMWMGSDPEDTSELLSGRWNKEPALSVFPKVFEHIEFAVYCPPNDSANYEAFYKHLDCRYNIHEKLTEFINEPNPDKWHGFSELMYESGFEMDCYNSAPEYEQYDNPEHTEKEIQDNLLKHMEKWTLQQVGNYIFPDTVN